MYLSLRCGCGLVEQCQDIDRQRSIFGERGELGAFGTKIDPSLSGGGDVRPKGRNGWQKGRRGR